MRILHTSDWHLGRSFGSHALLDDQGRMLERIVELITSERIDLVVVAGDVYDRAIPANDAVVLLRDGLQAIRAAGARIALIAGNHDGAERVAAFDGLLADGLHVAGGYRRAGAVETLVFDDGELDLVLVPYLDPMMAPGDECGLDAPAADAPAEIAAEVDADADAEIAADAESADPSSRQRRRPTHASVLERRLAAASELIAGRRSVAVAHAFVAGGACSDSERELSVGGVDRAPTAAFDGFTYAALGHLHRPQTVGRATLRYSGTPLAYSFSETEAKSVTIVDLPSSGAPTVTPAELGVCRGVSTITGTLDQLLTDPTHRMAESRWVQARLTDRDALLEPMARLRRRFPFIVELQRVGAPEWADDGRLPGIIERSLTPLALAVEFWQTTASEAPSAEIVRHLERALSAAGVDP
ncbi:MAG: exonuclease SbcCD subunit D [Acidimicrobiia bacterium]